MAPTPDVAVAPGAIGVLARNRLKTRATPSVSRISQSYPYRAARTRSRERRIHCHLDILRLLPEVMLTARDMALTAVRCRAHAPVPAALRRCTRDRDSGPVVPQALLQVQCFDAANSRSYD